MGGHTGILSCLCRTGRFRSLNSIIPRQHRCLLTAADGDMSCGRRCLRTFGNWEIYNCLLLGKAQAGKRERAHGGGQQGKVNTGNEGPVVDSFLNSHVFPLTGISRTEKVYIFFQKLLYRRYWFIGIMIRGRKIF